MPIDAALVGFLQRETGMDRDVLLNLVRVMESTGEYRVTRVKQVSASPDEKSKKKTRERKPPADRNVSPTGSPVRNAKGGAVASGRRTARSASTVRFQKERDYKTNEFPAGAMESKRSKH
jgi:hypothetical protein